MNPILSREIRGRFRDKRSFWLLFGVSALLCIAATLIYASATSLADTSGVYGRAVRTEQRTGRELFRFLALGNTFAWLLIAPALTATGLAKERERGLLENLWLSPFRIGAQIWGRLGAALCFLLALQVAVLPVYGIAVILGGVSLGDIGLAAFIIAMGALVCAAFGLFCSARSYRGSSALGAAFFGVALWSVVAAVYSTALIQVYTPTNFLVTFSHPVALLWILLSPTDFVPRFGAVVPISTPDALTFGLFFQFFASLALMWFATRAASKPLPDLPWSEGNPRLKKWRERVEIAKKARKERQEAARASETVAGALLYEVPVEKFVRFKDPLLSREVRGRFRLRQSGTWISLLRAATFIIAISCWMFIVFNAFDPASRRGSDNGLLLCLCGFGTLAIGVMSSTSLVRERESGTWESLHLSLLSPFQIVRSKWLSPLVTFAYWSTPFWILLPFSLSFDSLLGLIIVGASLSSVSAWGLWVSSRAPHSAAATSWTLATLLIALAGLPALLELGLGSPGYGVTHPYHPFFSLQDIFGRYQGDSSTKMEIVAFNFVFNALLTSILLWQVWRRLRRHEA